MTNQNGQGQVLGGQAPSESARLGAKQGHATSAKVATDIYFTKNNPLRPLRPLREISGFTLIELMAATTVLSIILLMMVGMQDQMAKAWSNSNRRTDATREARAACRLMAQDFSCLVFRRTNSDSAANIPAALRKKGVPFLYSSNGLGPAGGADLIALDNSQPSASYFFGLSARKPSGSSPADLGIFGYYIASQRTTNVSGFVTTNYNLYRHYVTASNAVNNLNTWFGSTDPTDLFNPTNAEILARNTCNLRITLYNGYKATEKDAVTNGLNYSFDSGGEETFCSGSKVQVEISVYPEDFAQRIPYTNWGNSTNIRKFARSYEFRIDIPRE
jgi:prepilin-type N-terminal cleavage/methylation domain-containing protein